jgi:hypothetical protein
MTASTFFDDHSHDRILILLATLLVDRDCLCDFNAAHQVTADEDKVGSDDTMGINVAQRVAWSECLIGCNDGRDFDSGARATVTRPPLRVVRLGECRGVLSILDGLLDELWMASAHDKDFANTSKDEGFECPIEKWSIANWDKTLGGV